MYSLAPIVRLRVIAIFLFLFVSVGNIVSVPAYRGWQQRMLTDGTLIQLRQIGDEFYHYWETEDGRVAKEQPDGRFVVTDSTAPSPAQVAKRRSAANMYVSRPRKAIGQRNFAPKGLVILVQFADVKFKSANDNAAFNNMLNQTGYSYGGATGSAVDYFRAQSNGQYVPSFDVFGPVTLPNNLVYYGQQGTINGSEEDDMYIADFVIDAVKAADDAGCDFSQYDSDSDGKVDIVYFFYAGKGQAAGGSSETIWPHNWELNSALYYKQTHGTSGYSYNNLPCLDDKRINNYVCSAELKSDGERSGIGTLCHEFSHVLGLPDYYDTDYGTNYDNSLTPGEWSIMDGGSYNNDEMTPPNYSVYDKYFLGWVTPKFLAKNEADNIVLTTAYDDAYQITGGTSIVSYTNTGTVYYIENRQQSGWDEYLPYHGMLVWQVKYNSTAWSNNKPNNTANSPRFTLVSAGGNSAIGTKNDPFPGYKRVTTFTPFTGCALTEITENSGSITFKYNGGVSCHNVLTNATGCRIEPSSACVENGDPLTATITPTDDTYDFTSLSLKRGSTTLTEGTHYTLSSDKQSLTVNASAITGSVSDNITITAVWTKNRYSYFMLGEQCTEELSGMVGKNMCLNLTIEPVSGYGLADAACWDVTMGGTMLIYGTDFSYDPQNSVFTIPQVTGDVEIIATGYHLVKWYVCGELYQTDAYADNDTPVLPTLSSGYNSSFYGWVTSEHYTNHSAPSVLSAAAPVSANAAYYAVFRSSAESATGGQDENSGSADNAAAGTVLWAEDFSGYIAGYVPDGEMGNDKTGIEVYNNGSVVYGYTNGGGSTKIYDEKLATGSAPELLIAKNNGSLSVAGVPTGGATAMTLTFKTNRTSGIIVTSQTAGITIGEVSVVSNVATCEITNTDVAAFDLTITNTNSSNCRVDDFSLVVKTAGVSSSNNEDNTDENTLVLESSAVTAVSNAGTLTLTWADVEGADAYTVKLLGGEGYTTECGAITISEVTHEGSTNTCVINGLIDGLTYTYSVMAHGEKLGENNPDDESPLKLVVSADNGTVSPDTIQASAGEQVTITVTPNDGYTFSYWSDFNTENPRTVIMSEALTTLTAVCVPIDTVVYQLCLASESERSVYFIRPDDWQGEDVYCYIWTWDAETQSLTEMTSAWPGDKAVAFNDRLFKYMVNEDAPALNDDWMIIWNYGGSEYQSEDHKYVNNAVFSIEQDVTFGHGNLTTINYICTKVCNVVNTIVNDTVCLGVRYYHDGEVKWEAGDFVYTTTYVSSSGGDSVVTYNLHVSDCDDIFSPCSFSLAFRSNIAAEDGSVAYNNEIGVVFTEQTAANAGLVTNIVKVYPARTENQVPFGAKFGSSSGAGSITFTLAMPLIADSVVFSAAQYNSGTKSFSFNGRQLSLPAGERKFEKVKLEKAGWLDTITISSTGTGRFYLQGLTIYGRTESRVRQTEATICEGEKYVFYERTVSSAGIYSHAFSADGTDSVVFLHLNVIERQHVLFYDTITTSQQLIWHGHRILYPNAGDKIYYDTVRSSVTGCDSINELRLHVVKVNYPTLTLALDKDTVVEKESALLTVSTSYPLPTDENISLRSGKSDVLDNFPESIVMPAGDTVKTVDIITRDNSNMQNIVNLRLTANGNRFCNTDTVWLIIEDDDTPMIQLSLSETEVTEGAAATINAVVQRLTCTDKGIRIRFSDNSGGRVRYPAATMKMAAGVTSLTASLSIIDNAFCEGTQNIEIVAAVDGAYAGYAKDTAALTVFDNDSPALTLSTSTNMLPEGKDDAAVLTVTRNTIPDTDLVLTLAADNNEGLIFPSTLVIPAGETSIQTTIAVQRNNIEGDNRQVTFRATAEGYDAGECYVMIVDKTLPDAIITHISTDTDTAEVEATLHLTLSVKNTGAAGLAKGVNTRLYMDGSVVGTFSLPHTLPIDSIVVFQTELTLPDRVGMHTIYAVVNEDKQVREIVHDNNRSQTLYITTIPSFIVSSITVSRQTCLPGDSVTISGRVTGSKAANATVEVYAVNNGYRTSLTTTADSDGYFSTVFKPTQGQSGHFAIGACYPSEKSYAQMVAVDYYGMATANGFVTCMINTGVEYNGNIYMKNNGSLPLTNVHAIVDNLPENCNISFATIRSLQAGETASLGFTLYSDRATTGNDWEVVNVSIVSDEGLRTEKTLFFFARDPRSNLICSENKLTASVSIQQPLVRSLYLQNTGMGETGEITLVLPEWIQPLATYTIPSVAPGEYAEVALKINTAAFADKLNLPINGVIALNPANGNGLSLPFTITPVSDLTGVLQLDVCDENTYYAEGHPHLSGAQVLVKNATTHAVIVSGLTDSNGRFETTLPEGYYSVSVTADGHDSYTNNICLLPADTTNLTVNLSIRAISVNWTVEEITVEDTYEITTTVTYETHVPQPVVVVSAPARIAADELQAGESLIYTVDITNRGLIRAEDVNITLPDGGEEYLFEALAFGQPFNLEAGQTVQMPVRVTKRSATAPAPQRSETLATNTDDARRAGGQIHNIIECHGNMVTLYYWDCGTDRKWHQYAIPLVYARCDEAPIIHEPQPGDGDDHDRPALPYIHIPTTPFPWPPTTGGTSPGTGWYSDPIEPQTLITDTGCEPCQNEFLINLANLANDVAQLLTPETHIIHSLNNAAEHLSEAVSCYNNINQGWDTGYMALAEALLGCMFGDDGGDTDIIEDLLGMVPYVDDVLVDLYAFFKPCSHTADNAAYAPARADNNNALHIQEPEYLVRYKQRTTLLLDAISARNSIFYQYIPASVWQYCSNAEIYDILSAYRMILNTSAVYNPAHVLQLMNTVKPAALPDELWQMLTERISNTIVVANGEQATDNNYISQDSLNYYMEKITDCETQAHDWGYSSMAQMYTTEYNLLQDKLEGKSNSVCASISLQLSQRMTLTRQAFRGTLTIFNGHETQPMTDIRLTLRVQRSTDGLQATEHEFQMSLEDMIGMTGDNVLDGQNGWTIGANSTGSANILFIPTVYAAPETDTEWSFGGTLSYTDPFTGLTVTRDLYPVTLTVKPTPLLRLSYFMQRDVFADDPLTEEQEQSLPAEFALLINNIGYGNAENVVIQTQAPTIVDNQKGLLCEFDMLYAMLNGTERSLPIGTTTTTAFGTIPAHGQAYAQWFFQSSLLGHFTSYDVTPTHVSSYNNPDLSLLDNVSIHEMVRGIAAPSSAPQMAAWLVNDMEDEQSMPEHIYLSDGTVETLFTDNTVSLQRVDALHYRLTLAPTSNGWNYAYCTDPTDGRQTLEQVTRLADNAEISLRNVWQTPCVMKTNADPIHEKRLHIADNISQPTTYLLTFTADTTTYNDTVRVDLCEGEPFEIPGSGFTPLEGGVGETAITFGYKSRFGADSVVTYQLYYHPKYNLTINDTICSGDYYLFGTDTLTIPDTYHFEGTSIWGCDSLVTLNLAISESFAFADSAEICEGDVFEWRGMTITEAGEYQDVLTTLHNCDSIYYLTLNKTNCGSDQPDTLQQCGNMQSYNRQVQPDSWGTICLPYQVDKTNISGVDKLYKPIAYKREDGKTFFDIYYEDVSVMQAGYAYLFNSDKSGNVTFSYCADDEPTEAVAADYGNALQGFIGENDDDLLYVPLGAWVLHPNAWEQVVISSTSDWIYSKRAYLVLEYLDDYSVILPANIAACKVVRVYTGTGSNASNTQWGDSTATAISDVQGEGTGDELANDSITGGHKPQKVLFEGHFYILMPDGSRYTATGQKAK